MIVDVYNYFKKHPRNNKLVGSNFLFVEYKCPINIEEFLLWTESHLITFVIHGKKDWITSEKTYELIAGDALFVRKGIYTTRQYLEEDYCVMLFFINDDFIRKFIAENELLFNIVLNQKNNKLLDFFNAISQTKKTNIEDTMMKNFHYNLKIDEFARLCGRSLSSFKRDFESDFKTTPSRWLTTKRLEYSKTLLLGTNLNVTEICYESGFINSSHFIQAFKNKYNLPPNLFRTESLNK